LFPRFMLGRIGNRWIACRDSRRSYKVVLHAAAGEPGTYGRSAWNEEVASSALIRVDPRPMLP